MSKYILIPPAEVVLGIMRRMDASTAWIWTDDGGRTFKLLKERFDWETPQQAENDPDWT